MKTNTLIRHGLVCGALLTFLFYLPLVIVGPTPGFLKWGELVGYTTMLLVMLATVLAMRAERDRAGAISFTRAFFLGCGVSAIAALIFGFATWVFFLVSGEVWSQAVYDFYLKNAAGNPKQIAELEANKSFFFNYPLQAAVMFATVFLIGAVESVIGAWWFSRRRTAT